jgi:hypothetical protein
MWLARQFEKYMMAQDMCELSITWKARSRSDNMVWIALRLQGD